MSKKAENKLRKESAGHNRIVSRKAKNKGILQNAEKEVHRAF